MKKIFINYIHTDNGVDHGIAALNKTVIENMPIVFSPTVENNLKVIISNNPGQSFYSFTRFCQYVMYFQYQPGLGITLKFSDFKNDIDLALDEYSTLGGKQWKKEDRDKIMKIFEDIRNNPTELAEFVIKDPVAA
ncbi:hypothetical protein HB364_10295 [Pseudoflavitalea sp. X16]|uniref:hypothetical protein n=1 Tax=Paraflavitalea devenefica TaxID=2716334 RepID=UPI001422C4E7|nr:hypothetical protein [Paraflavitalea devenefica]NII25473.1 hypothetical protein [Paraflavitalea devenefica]